MAKADSTRVDTTWQDDWFTDNQEAIKHGTIYLKVAALIGPIYPVFFITTAVFQAVKKPLLQDGNIIFKHANQILKGSLKTLKEMKPILYLEITKFVFLAKGPQTRLIVTFF